MWTHGIGQDIANLFVVVPATLIAMHFAFRGSIRATLVWLGLLIYTAYSFIVYAFFIHFGLWFLVYVAVLGLSVFALFGAVIHMDLSEVFAGPGGQPEGDARRRAAVLVRPAVRISVAIGNRACDVFGCRSEGFRRYRTSGQSDPCAGPGVRIAGMIVTAMAVHRRKPLGLLFAAATFSAAMGIARLAMFVAEYARAIPAGPVVV